MRKLPGPKCTFAMLMLFSTATTAAPAAPLTGDIKDMSTQYGKGRYVLAENMGREILRRDPTNLDVHYMMGNIYYKLDNREAARQQYTYCINACYRNKQNADAGRLAAAALARLNTLPPAERKSTKAALPPYKLVGYSALHRAESILEKADAALTFKRNRLETAINHTEEFARSRIREIPINTMQRRLNAFAGIAAARANEDYFTAPNNDRPAEIAAIRATEGAKVRKLLADYAAEESQIVAEALRETDAILGPLPAAAEGLDQTAPPPGSGNKDARSKAAWEKIKNSEIIFVQDMSINMSSQMGDTNQSKWEWCASRIGDFADSVGRNGGKYFSLMQAYQHSCTSYKDLSAATIRQLFATTIPSGSAVLAAPLQQLAYDHLTGASSKPIIILVFTSGHMEIGEGVEVGVKAIIERMKHPEQARIIFFQIGDDPLGTATLKMLDEDLTYAGHKYDIVDWVRFEDLQTLGVSQAVLQAYERPRHEGTTTTPAKSPVLAERLALVRKQLAVTAKK